MKVLLIDQISSHKKSSDDSKPWVSSYIIMSALYFFKLSKLDIRWEISICGRRSVSTICQAQSYRVSQSDEQFWISPPECLELPNNTCTGTRLAQLMLSLQCLAQQPAGWISTQPSSQQLLYYGACLYIVSIWESFSC